MSEDEILRYLGGKKSSPTLLPRPKGVSRGPQPRPARAGKPKAPSTYKNFSATHLYCPRCKKANPVRESVLLFLPDGDLYNYACQVCGTSVGTRKAGQD